MKGTMAMSLGREHETCNDVMKKQIYREKRQGKEYERLRL